VDTQEKEREREGRWGRETRIRIVKDTHPYDISDSAWHPYYSGHFTQSWDQRLNSDAREAKSDSYSDSLNPEEDANHSQTASGRHTWASTLVRW